MNSVTHIVGPVVVVNGRVIQRCQLCGEKLVDSKGAMVPVDDAHQSFPTWEPGKLLRGEYAGDVDLGGVANARCTAWSIVEDEDQKIPPDSCIDFVED